MAPPGTLRVGRYFAALLAIVAVLYVIVFWPGARHTPKLGLDLEGGTQVIFTARNPGGGTPSKTSMTEAQQIMEARVNGSGVTEATVVVQGSNQLVVSIPGSTNTDIFQARRGGAAEHARAGDAGRALDAGRPRRRVVRASRRPARAARRHPAASPDGGSRAREVRHAHALAPRAAATTTPAPSTGTEHPGSVRAARRPPHRQPRARRRGSRTRSPASASPSRPVDTAFSALQPAQQQALQAALTRTDCSLTNTQSDKAPYYVACDSSDNAKATGAFLLGSVIVPGTEIKSAGAQSPNVTQGQTEWTVALTFKSAGDAAWAHYTGAHNVSKLGQVTPNRQQLQPYRRRRARTSSRFTLDGQVISAPYNQSAINGGTTQISGSSPSRAPTTSPTSSSTARCR